MKEDILKFRDFLKKKGVFGKFISNCHEYNIYFYHDKFKDIYSYLETRPTMEFLESFNWSQTPEGALFWGEIENSWQNKIINEYWDEQFQNVESNFKLHIEILKKHGYKIIKDL